jgi:GMP synthase-like glutamine amidotransferase
VSTAILVAQNGPSGPIGALEAPLREAGLEIETWHAPEDGAAPDPRSFAGVIALGGVTNPDEEGSAPWLAEERKLLADALEHGVPAIGLCLGAQLLAQAAGGEAPYLGTLDLGWHQVELTAVGGEDPLLGGLPRRFAGFQWHRYGCRPPGDAALLGEGPLGVQAFRVGERAWGLQFHLEVDEPIVNYWLDVAPHEPEAAGASVDELRERTAAEAPGSTRRAHEVGARFARLAAGS